MIRDMKAMERLEDLKVGGLGATARFMRDDPSSFSAESRPLSPVNLGHVGGSQRV
jgi:hypothetical protein